MKRFLPIGLGLLLILSACGSSELSAQDKRNNFDSCKIKFLQKIDQKDFENNKSNYEKQAEEGCQPLLDANQEEIDKFVYPTPSLMPKKPTITFDAVCAKIRSAAYAHREFRNDDESEDFYDRWYGRIRSYFQQAASLMRSMDGNYDSLIADAENAAVNARGVNAGSLLPSEERLYSACKLSEEVVWNDFEKWMG